MLFIPKIKKWFKKVTCPQRVNIYPFSYQPLKPSHKVAVSNLEAAATLQRLRGATHTYRSVVEQRNDRAYLSQVLLWLDTSRFGYPNRLNTWCSGQAQLATDTLRTCRGGCFSALQRNTKHGALGRWKQWLPDLAWNLESTAVKHDRD